MKRVQLNFHEMVSAVLAHAKNHGDAWRGVEPVMQSIEELENVSTELEKAARRQGQAGEASPKDNALTAAFAEVQQVGQKVASFARRQGDELLEAQVRLRTYQLEDMAEAEALRRCDTVLEKATEHLAALAPYKVTAADLARLENAIKAARAHKDSFRESRTDSSTQTTRIPQLEKQARRILESLDLEVESMVEDEEFVEGYFIARRIFDRRGRSEQASTDPA
ncbi:MAG: hypothetical protein EOO15_17870 [Chitinophagaceae bacterium]|nr:MAG: hypothetical protein EOO15_17870 [Chitinophagaceae bacterium]